VGKAGRLKAGEMLNMLDPKGAGDSDTDGLIPDDLLGIDRFWRASWCRAAEAGRLPRSAYRQEGVEHDAERARSRRLMATARAMYRTVADRPMYVDAERWPKHRSGGPVGAIRIVPKSWEKTSQLDGEYPALVRERNYGGGTGFRLWFGPPIGRDELSERDGTFAWIDELQIR